MADLPIIPSSYNLAKNQTELNDLIAKREVTSIKLSPGLYGQLIIPDGRSQLKIQPDNGSIVFQTSGQEPAGVIGLGCSDIELNDLKFNSTWASTTDYIPIIFRMGYKAKKWAMPSADEAKNEAELPNRIYLNRIEVNGTKEGESRIGILGNARNLTLNDCVVKEIHQAKTEAQAFLATNTTGRIDINRGQYEGAGQCIFFGGAEKPNIKDLVTGINLRGVTMRKPEEWKGKWLVKNSLEFKDGTDVIVSDCWLINCWQDGQDGSAVLLTPRYGKNVSNISIYNNHLVNVAGGFLITAKDNLVPSPYVTGKIYIAGNTITNIGAYGVDGSGYFMKVGSPDGSRIEKLSVLGNKWYHSKVNPRGSILFEGVAGAIKTLEMSGNFGTRGNYHINGPSMSDPDLVLKTWATSVNQDWKTANDFF